MHVWLHGSSGAGKTAVATSVLSRLRQEAAVQFVSVNCWEKDTLYEILDQIIAELKVFRAEEHRSSVKMERLQRQLGSRCLLILLDEIDKIAPCERARVLYSLNQLGNTGLICISASLGSFYEMEERIRSRINPRTVAFKPYSAEEIAEILNQRAQVALAQDACPAFLIKRMAAVCNGDSRVAIKTLRNAADVAQRQGHPAIQARDLSAGWNDCQDARMAHVLDGLTEDHRLLYKIAAESQGVLSTALREAYLQRCSQCNRKPVADRTFSAYVNQLVRLGLLTCERARVKGNVRLLKPATCATSAKA
jgi:archaeal cell division control protein 6